MPGRRYSGPVVEPDMFFIPLIAVLAPLLARGVSAWVRVPIVVFELVLGILLGPDVFAWVQPSNFVDDLSDFGLATLFFVAGSEINFEAVRGRPILRASLGWLTSLVIGLAVGVLIAPGKLTDFTPLYQQPGSDSAVSQYDKDDVEAAGLVKFDFLGLATLTILELARKFIVGRHAGQK